MKQNALPRGGAARCSPAAARRTPRRPPIGRRPSSGGTLTVPWSGDVDSIDPGITYYSGGYMVAGVTQRTPMAYEPGRAQARPDLATTAPTVSDDGKTVTVKLRSGVHFSPPVKREVVAADVKYAIERGFFKTVNNPYAPAYFGDVVGAEPGAEAGHADRRHHDAGRAHGRVQALPPDRRNAGRGARAAARRAGPARLRAAAGPREGLRATAPSRSRPARTWSATYEPGTQIDARPQPELGRQDRLPPGLPGQDLDAAGQRRRRDRRRAASSTARAWSPATTCCRRPCSRRPSRSTPDQLELVDSGGGRWAALNTKVAPFDDVNVRKAVLAGFDRQATLLALGGKKVGTVATHFLPPGMPGFEQAGGADGTGADYLATPGGRSPRSPRPTSRRRATPPGATRASRS